MQNNMQNITRNISKYVEKYANPFSICRILTGLYYAYFVFIYTPQFADEGQSPGSSLSNQPGIKRRPGAAGG